MAEVLGLGLTHYPSLLKPDAIMSGLLRRTLDDPDLPPSLREPGAWPPEMQAEWEADQRGEAAVTHRTRVWSDATR